MFQKAKTTNRLTALLLAFVMLLSLVPGVSLTAFAATTELSEDTTTWENGDYVVPAGGVTISGHITVNGTVNLTLTEGATLTANMGITLSDGATLNVSGEGAMAVNGSNNNSNSTVAGTGTLVLTSGTLTVKGGNGQTISSGNNKTGANGGIAINGAVTVSGGTLTATGGNGGNLGDNNQNKSGAGGAAISGAVTVNGGAVTVTGGNGGNITGGFGNENKTGAGGAAISGSVTVNGGAVTVTGGNGGKKNTGGFGNSVGAGGAGYGGTLTLGKNVKLYEGTDDTGTVLDENDSVSRVYEGAKKQSMFAYGPDIPQHEHHFTSYTANGDTITAVCEPTEEDDECTLENNTATLTIVPAASGGSTAEFTGDTDEFDLTNVEITYKKKDSTGWNPVDSATVAAATSGFFEASAIIGGKPISVRYGINAIHKGTATGGENCDFSVKSSGTVNAIIEPVLTLATGYEVKKITVKDENSTDVSDDVGATTTGFTMPDYDVYVDVEFGMIDYTITKSSMSYGSVTVKKGESEVTTANYGDNITLAVTSDTGFTLKSLTVKDIDNKDVALSGSDNTRTFEMPASNVTVSAEFEGEPFGITTAVSPAIGGTVTVSGTGVATANDEITAKAGTEVTLTVTPAMGFDLVSGSVTVTGNSPVDVTKKSDTSYTFTMPPEAVTVSATFEGKPTTATLSVTGGNETTRTAKLLDSSYNEINEVTEKAGDQFILLVNKEVGYDFNVTYGTDSPVTLTEFTENEYKAYVAYAKENDLAISSGTILAWATMPGVAGDNVALKVTFSELKPFTILYQPSDTSTTAVWCKFAKSGTTTEPVSLQMKSDAVMGDGNKVFSLKVMAGFSPNQVDFATSSDGFGSGTMTNINESTAAPTQDSGWTAVTGGKAVVIGGNAKTVIAAFVTDANAIPVYNTSREMSKTTGGVEYRLAVVVNGAAGTVTAPDAPASSDPSITFAGWQGFTYDDNGMMSVAVYEAGATGVPVRGNTSFNATWKTKQLTVKLNSNGGEGGSGDQTVTYGNTLPNLEPPTRYGFAFDGWTVSYTVTENGELFVKGTPFVDLNTPITSDMGLTAQWKHVHTYTCYRITLFPNLSQYHKNDSAVHVAVCSCLNARLEKHSFDSNGVCACGYSKAAAENVNLEIFYVDSYSNSTLCKGLPQPMNPKQGQEVTISAPDNLIAGGHDVVFTKWQASTDGGTTWSDLAATTLVSFIIPCNMKVRALYINPITKPQLELSASKYEQEVEVKGQTKKADNILYQMNYKLPDGYTFVDAGVRLGDNDGIVYYEMKEKTTELGTGGKVASWAACAFLSLFSGGPETPETSSTETYYEVRKNNALDEYTAATLAKYMYENKPVSIKAEPILWESKATTKGMSGSVATIPPLGLAQAEDGNNWIYGIAWMRYKNDKTGKIETIYTDALAATLKHMPANTVTKQGS